MQLAGRDDDADGSQHALDDGRRHRVPEGAGPGEGECHLHHASHHAHREHPGIAGGRITAPEFGDRAEDDADQAGSGPLDGEGRTAEARREEAADDRGDEASRGGRAAGQGDAQAERSAIRKTTKPAVRSPRVMAGA